MTTVTLASPYINPNYPRTFFAMEDSSSDTLHSYVGPTTEEIFSLTVGGGSKHSTLQISLGSKKKAIDGELDIFGAEKYFSGGMDGDKMPIPERSWKKEPEAAKRERGAGRQIKFSTPSTCSEASGNSQSLLLRDVRRESSLNGQSPANSKRFLSVMRCKCSCYGKNSVGVEHYKNKERAGGEYLVSSKQIQTQLWNKKETGSQKKDVLNVVGPKREVCSTLPTLNPVLLGNLTVGREFEAGRARIHSEALGPPALAVKESLGSCPGRSLTTTLTTIAAGRGGEREDDLGSESSSDLFEIESLSTNPHPFFQQDKIGEVVLAPTTCYEPSEASIEWSVATASAANFSVASDYSELQVRGETAEMKKATRHQRPSLFTGCASDKAVKVVANTHKTPEKVRTEQSIRRPGIGVMPVMKYHAESCRVVDFELVRPGGHAFAARCNPTPAPPHHR